jgi:hypothetical protein
VLTTTRRMLANNLGDLSRLPDRLL